MRPPRSCWFTLYCLKCSPVRNASRLSERSMSRLTESHTYPGKLIIAEGIDGSGKSTQMVLLQKWLVSQRERVFFTEWNSSPLVKKATKAGKRSDTLTPTTFSLLHATDF